MGNLRRMLVGYAHAEGMTEHVNPPFLSALTTTGPAAPIMKTQRRWAAQEGCLKRGRQDGEEPRRTENRRSGPAAQGRFR